MRFAGGVHCGDAEGDRGRFLVQAGGPLLGDGKVEVLVRISSQRRDQQPLRPLLCRDKSPRHLSLCKGPRKRSRTVVGIRLARRRTRAECGGDRHDG